MESFNPNAGAVNAAPSTNWQQRQQAVLRQRMLAEMLRKQANATPQPTGSMVSGHYVAPSIFQHLAPVLQQLQARQAETAANTGEQAFTGAADAAKEAWTSALPRATAAIPEQAGPVDPTNPAELTAKPAVQPSRGSVLQATLQGSKIPGNEKAAELWNKSMTADLEREDTQTFRASEAEAARLARLDAQKAQLEHQRQQLALQLADKAASREQLAAYQKMHDETLRAIAAINAASREKVAATPKPGSGKPVPQQVLRELNDLLSNADSLDNVLSTYKPEFAGVKGALFKTLGTYVPGVDEESANWWKEYNRTAALVERHKLFGATLTENEIKAWNAATIAPGMKDEVIKANLEKRAELANKVFNEHRTRQALAAGGKYDVDEVFQPRARSTGAPGATKPIQVKSMEEAMKLKPGTEFIDPNGVPRVR